MIEKYVGEIIKTSGSSLLEEAAKHLTISAVEKNDLKRVFVDTGEFIRGFEPEANQLMKDLAQVFSKGNMETLSKEANADSGYTLKDRILSELIKLMGRYEIPHETAKLYANRYLCALIEQLKEIQPQTFDRYFQAEWREELNRAIDLITTKIDRIIADLASYDSKKIDILSADALDLKIRRETVHPQIGISFFEIDDDEFRESFESNKNNSVIRVRAKCREEAIYCIVNELWRTDDYRPIYVVFSKDSWDKLTTLSNSGSIYIPWFYADEITAIENNTNVFTYSDGVPSFSRDELTLRPRTLSTIIKSLENAGLSHGEADALVNETHGLYVPMKKKILNGQYLKRPSWVNELPELAKRTCLLVGQWTEADGDKEIISLLYGKSYDDFISQISPYTTGEDPLIHSVEHRGERHYYLASVENTWEYVDIPCFDPIWTTFKSAFIDVLNESEKLFTYSHEERLKAQLNGERLFWSSTIRSGMIRTLIMKAYYKNDTEFQDTLNSLISDVFGYIGTEEQWKYISRYFKDLCEVAPKVVLNRLFAELSNPTGLLGLFRAQSSDFIFGKNEYIDILFGIEVLLVQKEYVARAFEWILKLDDLSFEYKSNSPKDIIGKVLCSWYSFSAYQTVEEKVYAAKIALETSRNAWDYVYEALPFNHQTIVGELCKPKYRDHVKAESVYVDELGHIVRQYVQLLLAHTESDPGRWGKLLKTSGKLDDSMRHSVFDKMLDESAMMTETDLVQLKNSIRRIIHRHRHFSSASWAMEENVVAEFERLLDEIKLHSAELEYEYLFETDRDAILLNPVPYKKDNENDLNRSETNRIIKEKIQEFNKKQLDLETLAKACAYFGRSNLGKYLALYGEKTQFNQSIFEVLFTAQESKEMALDYCNVVASTDPDVFFKAIQLKEKLGFDDEFIVNLYSIQAEYTEDVPEVDKATSSIKSLFWRGDHIFADSNYEWALTECKKYGTAASYVTLVYYANSHYKYDVDKLYELMCGIDKLEKDGRTVHYDYYLTELMKPLQNHFMNDPVKAHELAEIEIAYFPLLEWENMRCFQEEIKRTPEIYAELASIIYKKDSNDNSSLKTKEQQDYVNILYRLFYMAHFCPAEKNGVVDRAELENWIIQFKELLTANDQSSLFGYLLGRLWAYAPHGKDGYPPCEAVREIIQQYADDSMISEYRVAVYNQRGVYFASAGRNERTIAERQKETADHLRLQYPKTAEVFDGLYRTYKREAEIERREAENGQF